MTTRFAIRTAALLAAAALGTVAVAQGARTPEAKPVPQTSEDGRRFRAQPLTTEIYTADPSAHVFEGRIYVYPSHDVPTETPDDDLGNQYAMHDYRVLRMDRIGGPVTVGPVALDVKDVPWASKQTWAPDAAYRNGTYYLYMPARDRQGIFRIGVATSSSPVGPFKAEPQPIEGAYSMDPAVFTDADGTAQAKHFLAVVAPTATDLPVLDFEDNSGGSGGSAGSCGSGGS